MPTRRPRVDRRRPRACRWPRKAGYGTGASRGRGARDARKGAVHGRHGGLEGCRRLLRRQADDVAQEEHRALRGREHLEGGDERERHALLERVCARRIVSFEPRRRARLDPLVLRRRGGGRQVRIARRSELGASHAPRARLRLVEAHVRRDAVEPGAHERVVRERVPRPERARERLLHHVVDVARGSEHPVAAQADLRAMGLDDLFEGPLHAASRAARSVRCMLSRSSMCPSQRLRFGYGARDSPAVSHTAA